MSRNTAICLRFPNHFSPQSSPFALRLCTLVGSPGQRRLARSRERFAPRATPGRSKLDREMAGGAMGGEVALVYLMIAVSIGAAVAHLLSRVAPWLPYTPTLLIIGMITSLMNRAQDGWSPHVDASMRLWEQIDGHMLLFIFLPPLLFADSMGLQWNLIRRCVKQCALLAGPGVILGALLNGVFAHYVLPYGWDWNLCLSYGAVQAATDPVAVVALLKQLGASPSLTMIISGAARPRVPTVRRGKKSAVDYPRLPTVWPPPRLTWPPASARMHRRVTAQRRHGHRHVGVFLRPGAAARSGAQPVWLPRAARAGGASPDLLHTT